MNAMLKQTTPQLTRAVETITSSYTNPRPANPGPRAGIVRRRSSGRWPGSGVHLNRLAKLALLFLVCLTATTWSSRGFTLYNSNLYNYDFFDPAPPAADYDNPPDADLSDCIDNPDDHWAWPVTGGQVVITYWFDSSLDSLFPGPNGHTTELAIEAQIALAMQQWSSAAYGLYQWNYYYYGAYDSYARANPPILNVEQTQTIAQFMDARSATVHELGHILGFAHCDQGVNANPVANFAYFHNGARGLGSAFGGLAPYTLNSLDGGVPWLNYYMELLDGTPPRISRGFNPPGLWDKKSCRNIAPPASLAANRARFITPCPGTSWMVTVLFMAQPS